MFAPGNTTNQPTITVGSVLLIDLENCPDQIQYLQQNLEQFHSVVICYAQTGAKIPLDWLQPLSATVNSDRLRIFKMPTPGKNAADFGLCFFAGALMQQLDPATHFVIISNDTDLDYVVQLLKSQGRSAERIGRQTDDRNVNNGSSGQTTEKQTLVTVTSNTNPALQTAVKTYCIHLMTYSKHRPAKKATLLNSIKNKFKGQPETATAVFSFLTSQKVVAIAETKVTYNDAKIKEIASR